MSERLSFSALLKGFVFALVCLLALALLFSLAAYIFNFKNSTLLVTGNIALAVSVLLGAFFAARKAGQKGLLHGIALGALTLIVIIVLTMFWGNLNGMVFLEKAGLTLIAGAIGGIFGVR